MAISWLFSEHLAQLGELLLQPLNLFPKIVDLLGVLFQVVILHLSLVISNVPSPRHDAGDVAGMACLKKTSVKVDEVVKCPPRIVQDGGGVLHEA